MAHAPLRVGVLQFTPHYGKPEESRKKVEALCSAIVPGSLDLLVAPEMALTGYIFKDLKDIEPLCEEVGLAAPRSGGNTTISLAQSLSQRLKCYTLMGFPEVVRSPPESSTGTEDPVVSTPFDARPIPDSTPSPPSYPAYYNSALLTSPAGRVLHSFRKHFLFEADETWSLPGPGFQYIDLPPPLGRLAVAICMDLNPYRFETPWEKMELTRWCEEQEVQTLVMPMAWLRGEVEGSEGQIGQGGEGQMNLKVVNYWASRCEPLWEKRSEGGKPARQTLFVTSNRTGKEEGK